jgi:hypothetical protein
MFTLGVNGFRRLTANPVNEATEISEPVEREAVIEAVVCRAGIGSD